MGHLKLILLIPYLFAGLLFIALSIPLIRGKIAPNAWYGFRVRQTLENPRLWYAVNRYSAYHMLILGVVFIVVAVGLYFLPQVDFVSYAVICLTTVLAGLGLGLVRSFRELRRLSALVEYQK